MSLQATACGVRGGLAPPRITLALALSAVALYLVAGAAPPGWVFDRTAVAQGEWWRLVTGHLVHSDAEHLLWDVAALVLIGWMLERRDPRVLIGGLLAGAAAVDAWLWLGLPELERYCGLSGVLNTLMVLLVAQLWRETRQPWVVILALVLLIKPIAELHSGQALLTHTAWPSVPSAHLAGLVAGLCVLPLRGPGAG